MQYHHYSLSDIENMIPWERQTYVSMVAKHVHDENERIKALNEQAALAGRKKKR